MTVVDTFDRPDRARATRWTASLLVVLALHAVLLLLIALRHVLVEPIGMPPAAVMIDLAPLPAAAPAEPSPPPAVQPEVQTPLPEPQQEVLPLPEPDTLKLAPSPAPHPAVTLPPPQPPKPKPKVKRVEHPPMPQREAEPAPPLQTPAPAVAAPPTPMPQTAAPQSTASSAVSARASWQAQLLAWLEKYKRYPRVAQKQRQQGIVYLRFAIDRQGKVLLSQISKSSGFELLDDEVVALIERAQPVPSPPPEVSGNRIELLVPVSFSLHNSR
jgi:periplasmic protein TonB